MDSPHTPLFRHKGPPPAVFLATVFVVFVLTLSAADSVGFVPDYIDGSTPLTTGGSADSIDSVYGGQSQTVSLADLPQLGGLRSLETIVAEVAQPVALPERIVIPAIKMDLPIQNPATKNI